MENINDENNKFNNEAVSIFFYHQHRNYAEKTIGRALQAGYSLYKDIWIVIYNNTQHPININIWSKSHGQCKLELSKINFDTPIVSNNKLHYFNRSLAEQLKRQDDVYFSNKITGTIKALNLTVLQCKIEHCKKGGRNVSLCCEIDNQIIFDIKLLIYHSRYSKRIFKHDELTPYGPNPTAYLIKKSNKKWIPSIVKIEPPTILITLEGFIETKFKQLGVGNIVNNVKIVGNAINTLKTIDNQQTDSHKNRITIFNTCNLNNFTIPTLTFKQHFSSMHDNFNISNFNNVFKNAINKNNNTKYQEERVCNIPIVSEKTCVDTKLLLKYFPTKIHYTHNNTDDLIKNVNTKSNIINYDNNYNNLKSLKHGRTPLTPNNTYNKTCAQKTIGSKYFVNNINTNNESTSSTILYNVNNNNRFIPYKKPS